MYLFLFIIVVIRGFCLCQITASPSAQDSTKVWDEIHMNTRFVQTGGVISP